MKKKIAITGGIGSGKTTVGELIKDMGYPVFSCDEIYREISQTDAFIEKIAALFPFAVEEGKINKQKLGKLVFSNEEERKKLNKATHPLIMAQLLTQMEKADSDLVFAEVPLLLEEGFENLFEEIIIIQRNLSDRKSAVAQRDHLSQEAVEERIRAQFRYDGKKEKAYLKKLHAHMLVNEEDITELREKVTHVIQQLKKS